MLVLLFAVADVGVVGVGIDNQNNTISINNKTKKHAETNTITAQQPTTTT